MGSLRKSVKGFEGFLEVDSEGNIFSVDRVYARSDTGTLCKVYGRVLKLQEDHCGYLRLRTKTPSGGKITLKAHRVVAEAFIPNPGDLPQVNHKDGNKKNNNVENLEWIDNRDNQLHALETGLKDMPSGRTAKGLSFTTFAISVDTNEIVAIMNGNEEMRDSGFDYRLVSAVVKGKRKSHRNCIFYRIKHKGEIKHAG